MIVKTSKFKMNIKAYNNLYKLFQDYHVSEFLSGDEFILERLTAPSAPSLTEDEVEKFVLLVTHKNFLSAIKDNFITLHKLRNYNEIRIMTIIFVILFASDGVNANELFDLFREIKCAFKNKLLQYFWNETNLIQTALTGCKFFEDDYVLNQIINPVLNKSGLFQKTHELLVDEKIKNRMPKPSVVPDHVPLCQRMKRVPNVPLNTPVETPYFQATEVPKSLYLPDNVERRLVGEFERNRLKAQKLLNQAKTLDKNYCKAKKVIVPEEVAPIRFKAKKPPQVRGNVEIKGNVATVLREASLCVKEQEKEIKNIEDIMQGGGILDTYKELEEDVRQLEEKKHVEDIERKHLEGLVTFEEAMLAKKKLVECNKERYKKFMEEREYFLKQIEEWKKEEQEKIKKMVKRGQEIERNAKESEKRVKKEKKSQVDRFKDEKRKLLQEAYERQEEELARKVKLIQEIKTLHQLKSLHVKEFDRAESQDFGLLCQMSTAALQEKLHDMKIKMEEELEQKRNCIQKYREKQRKMIENVKDFIVQTRMSKSKRSVPNRPSKFARSPDLDKLKSQLEHVRELRMKNK